MTTKRARPLLVGIAGLIVSTALSACVVHDPYHRRAGYYGHGGVYYASPVYTGRRTTRYYRSPHSSHHRHYRRDRDYDRYDNDRRRWGDRRDGHRDWD
ncbi:MAG TPA: hypothetical protein VEL28_20420 [Candidatus Binatia bacterium]|nr:hypothetical protein [Candidatus Binatia bacterium]